MRTLTKEQKKHVLNLIEDNTYTEKFFIYLIDLLVPKNLSSEEQQIFRKGILQGYLSCVEIMEYSLKGEEI